MATSETEHKFILDIPLYHQTSSLTKSLTAVWIFELSTFGLVSKYLPIDEGIYIREGESVKNTKPDARALVIKTPFILYAIDSKLTWRAWGPPSSSSPIFIIQELNKLKSQITVLEILEQLL